MDFISLVTKRTLPVAVLLALVLAFAVAAHAQAPAASPGGASETVAVPAVRLHGHPARGGPKPSSAKSKGAKDTPPWAAVDPARADMAPAARPEAAQGTEDGTSRVHLDADHIDYGMKAHGASVSAGQTRDQNYNGNETGLGGELGLKLHF